MFAPKLGSCPERTHICTISGLMVWVVLRLRLFASLHRVPFLFSREMDICLSPPFRSISGTSIRDNNPTKHNDKDQTDRETQRKRKKQVNQESHLLSKSFLYSCKARIFVSLFLSSSQAPVYATIIQLSSPTKIKQAAKHSRSAQNKCHFRSLS